MSIIVDPRKASRELLTQLVDLISKHTSIDHQGEEASESYIINYIQKSESAWILFVHKEQQEEEQYVIKLLCHYSDQRYLLGSLSQRQHCQIEAFACNSVFSPNVYVGLANTYYLQAQHRRIIISHPTHQPETLNADTEYALIMRRLPSDNRLDFLLENANENKLRQHISHLVRHIVTIHNASPVLPAKEREKWGSFSKIKLKLKHNFSLADPLFEDDSYVGEMRERFSFLKDNLRLIFDFYPSYAEHFEQRVSQGYIKHCHGDLKGPNIWIERPDFTERYTVSLLDAIDFNPMYSNIDTLSDFATLVIDIQTRLRCTPFAHALVQEIIQQYLEATEQGDDIAAYKILHYYLVEKAFVGATISIVYDGLPELGMLFLQAAEECWEKFFVQQQTTILNESPVIQPLLESTN